MKTLASLVLLLPLAAMADDLRADVLVFQQPANLPSAPAASWLLQGPDSRRALSLDDANGLAAAGIALLPDAQHSLLRESRMLNRAPGYQSLYLLSFQQKAAAAHLRVFLPGGEEGEGLEGMIRLLPGKTPKAEVALLHRSPGNPQPVALVRQTVETNGKVQMLDGGRLAVLLRVGSPASFSAEAPAVKPPAPKPAAPPASAPRKPATGR